MPDQGLIYISMNSFLPSPGPKELLFFLLFKVLSDFGFRIFLGPSFLAVLKKKKKQVHRYILHLKRKLNGQQKHRFRKCKNNESLICQTRVGFWEHSDGYKLVPVLREFMVR